MAYLQLDTGARKRVSPKDAIRVSLAMKHPERASEALSEYVRHVTGVTYEDEVATVQGRLPYKENREL